MIWAIRRPSSFAFTGYFRRDSGWEILVVVRRSTCRPKGTSSIHSLVRAMHASIAFSFLFSFLFMKNINLILIQIEYKKHEKNTKIPFDLSFNFLDFKDNEVIVLFVNKKGNYTKPLLVFHFILVFLLRVSMQFDNEKNM